MQKERQDVTTSSIPGKYKPNVITYNRHQHQMLYFERS